MSKNRRSRLNTQIVRVAGFLVTCPLFLRIMREDRLSREALSAIQKRRLRNLLIHGYETVPYCRDVFDQLRIRPRGKSPFEVLSELPILSKKEIAANFPDRMLSNRRREIGSEHIKSSGTTADRIDVVASRHSQRARLALVFWRQRLGGSCPISGRRLEIPPDACSRICGVGQERPARLADEIRWLEAQGASYFQATKGALNRRLRASIRGKLISDETLQAFGPHGTCIPPESLQEYVDTIAEARPYLLTGLPTYLHEIARHVQRTGQKIHVPVVHPIGALSTPRQRRFIGRVLGAKVFEVYGSSELGTVASDCEFGQGLHVAMGENVVEVLRNGRPAKPSELGHIVVTNLSNWNMPLIRYRLGDVGRWHDVSCPCGRQTQIIECNGRLENLVVTAQGKPVTEENVLDLIYFDLGLRQGQLVERRRGQFDLLIVEEEDGKADADKIRRAFDELLDEPRRLHIFPVKSIDPEATGKFRFVKSASWSSFD